MIAVQMCKNYNFLFHFLNLDSEKKYNVTFQILYTQPMVRSRYQRLLTVVRVFYETLRILNRILFKILSKYPTIQWLWIIQEFDQNTFQELDDHGILMKFFKDFHRNYGGQPYSLSIQQFRWQSNSSRVRWPQNSCEILQGNVNKLHGIFVLIKNQLLQIYKTFGLILVVL